MPPRGGGAAGRRFPPPKPGTARIGGQEIHYDEEFRFDDRPQPAPLFPIHILSRVRGLNRVEKSVVEKTRKLRTRLVQGPHYTSAGGEHDESGNQSSGNKNSLLRNPFEAMPSYSSIFVQRQRTLPVLAAKNIDLKFVPRELWTAIDSSLGVSQGRKTNGMPKTTSERQKKRFAKFRDSENQAGAEDPVHSDIEAETKSNEDDLVGDQDDDFENEEDDMEGDYNAEQYFDDGGEDMDDDFEGGDGDGGD